MTYTDIFSKAVVILSLAALALPGISVNAQVSSELKVPVLELYADSDTFIDLIPFVEYWIDTSYNTTWKQVKYIPHFAPLVNIDTAAKEKVTFVDENLWLRFNLFNKTKDSIELILFIDSILIWSSQIKVLNNKIEIFDSCTNSRKLLCYKVIFPPTSTSTIYIKIDFRYFGTPDLHRLFIANNPTKIGLWPPKSFEEMKESIRQRKVPNLTLHSLVVGALAITILISFFQFFIFKEPVYISYASYLLIIVIYLWSWYNNINFNDTYALSFPIYYKNEAEILCFYLGYSTYFVFLFYFFKNEKVPPSAYSYLTKLLLFTILLGISNFWVLLKFNPSMGIIFYVITRFLFEVLNLIIVYLLFKLRSISSALIAFGALFLSMGITLSFTISYIGVANNNIFTNNLIYFYLGVILELFLFTSAIAYKFKLIKEENFANQKRITQSEINTLRLQINPHLIFNGLAVAGGLMYENPQNGIRYITKFANYLRNVLETSRHPLIPLSQELEMFEQYIFVEQTRRPDFFQFKIVIDPSIEADEIMVPPTIFQPYAENSIKHGFDDYRNDFMLTMHCWLNKDYLYVSILDNGIGRDAAREKKTGRLSNKKESLGLKITEERILMAGGASKPNNEVQIKDLKDDLGIALGTLVIIKIAIM